VAAELSLREFNDLRTRLQKAKAVQELPNIPLPAMKLVRIAAHVLNTWQRPVSFVSEHLVELHQRVADWDGWSGELRTMVFDWRGKVFTKKVKGEVERYCGQPEKWDELKAVLETY
jgi:hypothetical protein